jgi:ADP-heptose:LPS heptosyltransferase
MIFYGGHGLGDELMLTALVRGYKKAFPEENVRVTRHRRDIWLYNPYLNYGNGENGRTLRAPDCKLDFMGHFPRGTARDLGFELTDPTPDLFLTDAEKAEQFWPDTGRPVAAIDPGAGWPTRTWDLENWRAVAVRLLDAGWEVVALGAGGRAQIPFTHDLVGKTSIRQAASALGRVDVYLGNDSGLMHLAAAVGTPQVVVFGPVPHRARGYATTIPVEAAQPCGRHCGEVCVQPRAGKPRCMDEISVADVMAAVSHATVAR